MKTSISLWIIVACLFTSACSNPNNQTESTATADNAEENQPSATESSDMELPSSNPYPGAMTLAACESMSMEEVASILEVAASDLKKSSSDVGGVKTCSWGYYPKDAAQGINMLVTIREPSEWATTEAYKNDLKNSKADETAPNFVEIIKLDLPHEVIATYRKSRGLLTVFFTKDTSIQFSIGPNLKDNAEARKTFKKKITSFAESYLKNSQ